MRNTTKTFSCGGIFRFLIIRFVNRKRNLLDRSFSQVFIYCYQ